MGSENSSFRIHLKKEIPFGEPRERQWVKNDPSLNLSQKHQVHVQDRQEQLQDSMERKSVLLFIQHHCKLIDV